MCVAEGAAAGGIGSPNRSACCLCGGNIPDDHATDAAGALGILWRRLIDDLMATRMETIMGVIVNQLVATIRLVGQALGKMMGDYPAGRLGPAIRVGIWTCVHGREKLFLLS